MNVRVWMEDDEAKLIQLYTEDNMDVLAIAEHFGKNNRSIISKLVQLKIYKKPQADNKDKRSVKAMIIELEKILDIRLDGVNLTKKQNLQILVDGIKNKLEQ